MHVRSSTVNGVVSRHAAALRIVVLLAVALGAVAPARGYLFTRIADTNTPIPGGTGNFTGFDRESVPGPSNTAVTFRGFGASGQEGIYTGNQPSAITRIADRHTVMPIAGAPVTFQSFSAPSGGAFGPIHFQASGGGTSGIFRAAGTTLSAVDTASTASVLFGRASATGNAVAYLRNGVVYSNYAGALEPVSFAPPPGVVIQNFGDPDVGEQALGGVGVPLGVRVNYTENGQPRSGVLYDTSMTAPEILFPTASGATGDASVNWSGAVAAIQNGGQTLRWRAFTQLGEQTLGPPGGFNQFRTVAAGSPNLGSFDTEAVFSVSGSAGEAIYYFGRQPGTPSQLNRIIGTGDALDGRIVQAVNLGRDSEVGLVLSFVATFTDGSSGIYSVALIPEPATCGLFAPVVMLLARRRRTAPALGSFRQARRAVLV